MAKIPNDQWHVIGNTAPVQLAENLWRVEGDLPNMPLKRCMLVVRLESGSLLIHNAIAMDEDGMAWLEALGTPSVLIVPNAFHRMDAARFKARYPDLTVVCPRGSRKKVAERVEVDHTYDVWTPPDDTVSVEHFEGTKGVEGVITVRSEDGASLIFNDTIFNLEHGRGVFWTVYGKWLGNTGGPRITTVSRNLLLKDKPAAKAFLLKAAETPSLKRILVAHGDVIDQDAATILRGIAETL